MESLFDAAKKPVVRAAVVHLYATGPRHAGTNHGLLHVGLLPLTPDAQVREWVLNPGRDHSAAVFQASRISNQMAAEAPTWDEARTEIQAAFAQLDAVLLLDRAGQPSPERDWLEHVVLADMVRPPASVSLDELLAFFLPKEVLDDADDLKERLLSDKVWAEQLAYEKSKPQLPFVLHAMRRSVRWVLESLLRPQGAGSGQWLPAYALLHTIVREAAGSPRALRGFRLLRALAQMPNCCDDLAPAEAAETTREAQKRRLPKPPTHPDRPQPQQAQQLLLEWLARWRDQSDDAATPGLPLGHSISEKQVDEAFAELRKKVGAEELKIREPQLRYARFVARAMAGERGSYALEAGTGTGKTFGYLVPALEYLRLAPGAAVIVATSTKNLQEQMQHGELPALLRQPDGKRVPRYAAIRTALLKGKNCYLCAEALGRAFEASFERGHDWATRLAWFYLALRLRDTQGEVENIAPQVADRLGGALFSLLRAVTADRACRHGKLPDRSVCVYPAHRQRAEQAHLIIVNHHKLALLPPQLLERAKVCIVDEADRFPDNFRSALARRFSARELVDELIEPLLGGAPSSPRPGSEESPRERTSRREAQGLLRELDSRLGEEEMLLWSKVPADERPGFNDLEQAAYEAWDEARLHELVAHADLLVQVAEAMRDTPAAADALTSANEAGAAALAVAEPLRRRRAVRTVRQALHEVRDPLVMAREELGQVGRQFLPQGRSVAVLPFPLGETHWQDSVWVRPLGQRPYSRAYPDELRATLKPLTRPMPVVAKRLALVASQLGVALNLGTALDPSEAEEADAPAPDYDERLRQRLVRLTELVNGQTEVLTRLLEEFPSKASVPVLERLRDDDELGWALVRKPYELWPYLCATEPDAPLRLSSGELAVEEILEEVTGNSPALRLPSEAATPLFDLFHTVLFTSATLYVEDKLDYFQRQLDQRMPFAAQERIASVFDFVDPEREPVLASIPAYLPEFRAGLLPDAVTAWRVAQLRALLPLLIGLEGRTLVLFTSTEDMRFAAEWLAAPLAEQDIELICQRGASQWEIRRFRRVAQSVLLGVDRMWTGVDFAGPTLSQVVVWRLPMPSLGDPLISHRKRYESEQVFWQQFYRPAARLKLRQGFGRLVRREKDRGAFVVLDARAAKHFYADVLAELEIPMVHDATAHAALTRLTGPLLGMLRLGAEFQRRGLTLEKLLEVNW